MKLLPISCRAASLARIPAFAAGLRRGLRVCAVLSALALPIGFLALGSARAAEPHAAPAAAPQEEPTAAAAGASLTMPLAVYWKYTGDFYGNNPAAPIVTEDTAYFATGNRVYAVNLKDGSLKWRYPGDTTMANFVQTTPAVNDDSLFIGTGDGLYALNRADGKLRWPQPFHIKNGVTASPIVVGDTVYFGGGNGRIYALNAKTGDPPVGTWQQGVDAGGDFSSDFSVGGDMLYYITGGQDLHAVNLTSGQHRWLQRLPALTRGSVSPVLSGESIYIAAGNSISSWRANNGQQRWYLPLPSDAATAPAVDANGNLYIITSDRNIYAVDKSGRGLWHQAAKVDFEVTAQPIVDGNLLFVGTTQGGVYAFDTATGALKWNYLIHPSARDANALPAFTNVSSRPAVSGGTFYALTDDGTLTAFRHDAADDTPPTVSDMLPTPGDYINGRPPLHFGARITDIGSGVNESTITVRLDDQTIPRRPPGRENQDKFGYTYNPDEGTIDFYTVETSVGRSNALPDGHHSVTVSATDWMGNVTNKTWTFYVDDTIPRRTARTQGRGTTPGRFPGRFPGGGGPGGKGGGG